MIGRTLVPALTVALVLAAVAVGARPLLVTARPDADLLGVLAPRTVVAGERFVVFAGVRAEGPTRLLVRLCVSEVRCQLERSEPFPSGTLFKWVATADLSPGEYAVEAFLQVPTLLGYRSVDRFAGHVTAR